MESLFTDVSGTGTRVEFEQMVRSRFKCDVCARVVIKMTYTSNDALFDALNDMLVKHKEEVHSRKGNGAPSGAFAFTLTKSPKDPLTVGDMLTAVRKVMHQKSCPVKQYAWYYEEKGRDENGDPIHPHIHGMYETESGGRIETKHWKRAWSIWDPAKPMGAGFKGGYHRPVKSDEKYAQYMRKDGGMSESYGMDEQTE